MTPPPDPDPSTEIGLAELHLGATGSARITHASEAFARMLGRPVGSLAGLAPEEVFGALPWSELRQRLDAGSGSRVGSGRLGLRLRGRPVDLHWSVHENAGECTLLLAVEELGDRQRLVRSLRHRAFHDPLTGLPNRILLLEHLERALRDAPRHGGVVAAVYLDVDDLKAVNETLGHEAGDDLLVTVGHRLRRALRGSDVAGRLGGDEFAVVFPGLADDYEAGTIGDRLLETLCGPAHLLGQEVSIGVSIGLATSRAWTDGASAALLNRADEALRRAKRAGKRRLVVFDEALDQELRQRRQIVTGLRRAASDGELRLRYQPVVSLVDGRVTGAEALVRWQHQVRGLLAPDHFLPVAESSGCIVEVGAWVLRSACEQAAKWATIVPDRFVVSVNVSARQLGRGQVVQALAGHLDRLGLEPGRLRVEVTETALTESASARDELWQVDRLGVPVGIDDFGTGYASMTYLRQLPVRFLKIDRSFVADMARDGTHHAIVASVAHLATALGIEVIAEGIETEQQARSLIDLGCGAGQGFLYGRPVAAPQMQTIALTGPDG